MIYLKNFEQRDYRRVAPFLRKADVNEAKVLGYEVDFVLRLSLEVCTKRRWTVMDGSVPVGFVGVSDGGCIWAVGTDRMTLNWREFLRATRETFDLVTGDFEVVGNFVHQSNHVHIRWLEWLGCVLDDPDHRGFRRFVCVPSQRRCPPSSKA